MASLNPISDSTVASTVHTLGPNTAAFIPSKPLVIPDLSTSVGVENYLASTEFVAAHIQNLNGGQLGYIYRVNLENAALRKSVIFKHTSNYASSNKNVLLGAGRIDFEYEALMAISRSGLVTSESVVHVPCVLFYDPLAHVLITEDLAPARSLSSVLIEAFEAGTINDVSAHIGAALGNFMGKFYTWGAQPEQAGLRQRFLENTTLKRTDTGLRYELMIKNSIKYGMKREWMELFVQQGMDDAHKGGNTIIMGDFWADNILVSPGSEPRVYIIDWEMATYGRPEIDVGAMAASACTIAYIHPANASDFKFMQHFVSEYSKHFSLDDVQVAFSAGRELTSLGADEPWTKFQDLNTRRAIIQYGLELLEAGMGRNVERIRNSIVFRNMYACD
ncbi:phosphotransferase enzyme family protein [Ceratobasidium sp. AG-Ba]|nr:phosphotransferase enzyme family protein [Ceratobasidium sp. AG-Ba]